MKTIMILGNLGQDAQVRKTNEGKDLMTFSVAVNDRNTTTWFNCVSNLREKQLQYLLKGQCVAVTGELSVGSYNGRADLSVNVDRIELCGTQRLQQDGAQSSVAQAGGSAPADGSTQADVY